MYIANVPPKHLEHLVAEIDGEDHAQGIMEDLHELYFSGRIGAKFMGNLFWGLSKLGISQARPYAVPPITRKSREQQTGKYQAEIDRA